MNQNKLRQSVWDQFTSVAPKLTSDDSPKLFAAADAPLATPGIDELFSEFNDAHVEAARAVWAEMFRIANDATVSEEEAIENAINYVNKLNINADLKNYALMVFITHNEKAKRILNGTIPSITVRKPLRVAPSLAAPQSTDSSTLLKSGSDEDGGGCTPTSENQMNYFREDPSFNEHHERWHVVYPNGGIPYSTADGQLAYKERERHGEMFIYMHRQMLAHYDANRLACGLPKVKPYDFSVTIDEGYDPGTFVRTFGDIKYGARASNNPLRDFGKVTVEQQRNYVVGLQKAAPQGTIVLNDKKVKLTPDLVGLVIEALGGGVEGMKAVRSGYGNVHNMGHMIIASSSNNSLFGVMAQTATAVRDPVFFRWHKNIDNFSFSWQDSRKPESFDDAPNVLIRSAYDDSPDIIICDTKQLARVGDEVNLSDQQIGNLAFGGANWDADFSNGKGVINVNGTDVTIDTVDRIDNYLKRANLIVKATAGKPSYEIPYEFLNHKQYSFFIRLENQLPVSTKVTVRMFLAPAAGAEDRRSWMELDKFVHELGPFAKDVVCRQDTSSSVVRKAAILNPEHYNEDKRPIALTDIEQLFAAGIDNLIDGLRHLIDNPDSNELGLKNRIEQYKADIAGKTQKEIDMLSAALINMLDKYLVYFKIAWAELYKIPHTGLETLFDHADSLLRKTERAQILAEPVKYAQTLVAYLESLVNLLNKANPNLATEVNMAMLNALQQVLDTAYCDCGLPYSLLYPKGTPEGLPYYLMVMVTDWSKDITDDKLSCCGSMSYCGTKGVYPDVREMGYPFHRPFKDGLVDTFAGLENVAIRKLSMKLVAQPQ